MKTNLDLYTNNLMSNFGQATSKGLSRLLDKAVSYDNDDVTRIASSLNLGSQTLKQQVKPLILQLEKALLPAAPRHYLPVPVLLLNPNA